MTRGVSGTASREEDMSGVLMANGGSAGTLTSPERGRRSGGVSEAGLPKRGRLLRDAMMGSWWEPSGAFKGTEGD